MKFGSKKDNYWVAVPGGTEDQVPEDWKCCGETDDGDKCFHVPGLSHVMANFRHATATSGWSDHPAIIGLH